MLFDHRKKAWAQRPFIYVPDPETEDWLPETRCVHERVFTSPDEFDRMIEGHRFEDAVKGGYLNVSVGAGEDE